MDTLCLAHDGSKRPVFQVRRPSFSSAAFRGRSSDPPCPRRALRGGCISYNGRAVRVDQGKNVYVKTGDKLVLRKLAPATVHELPDGEWRSRLLFEDEHLIVVDKPNGAPVPWTRPASLPSGFAAVRPAASCICMCGASLLPAAQGLRPHPRRPSPTTPCQRLRTSSHAEMGSRRRARRCPDPLAESRQASRAVSDRLDAEGSRSLPLPPRSLRNVHRLDKETSGVLIMSKSAPVAAAIGAQFKANGVKKSYWAVLDGTLEGPESGLWSDRHDIDSSNHAFILPADSDEGKTAKTRFEVLEKLAAATVVELRPSTGRMHQLRAQAAFRRAPVAGALDVTADDPCSYTGPPEQTKTRVLCDESADVPGPQATRATASPGRATPHRRRPAWASTALRSRSHTRWMRAALSSSGRPCPPSSRATWTGCAAARKRALRARRSCRTRR